MNKSYLDVFDEMLIQNKGKKLLLHSCCAPCSSAVINELKDYFDITVFYYNPNIYPKDEYEKRKAEQIKLIEIFNSLYHLDIKYIDLDYNHSEFLNSVDNCYEKEGGNRCRQCILLRLSKTAEYSKNYDLFGTTLSVSPHKNCTIINEIGIKLENEFSTKFLISDFKKRNGYLNSITLSKQFGIYRQEYCGCEFSERKSEKVS